MTLILVSLIAGSILGFFDIVPEKVSTQINKFVNVTLFVILFTVGAQIGGNYELLAKLPLLGWKAFVIALLSVLGSVLALWGLQKNTRLTIAAEETKQ